MKLKSLHRVSLSLFFPKPILPSIFSQQRRFPFSTRSLSPTSTPNPRLSNSFDDLEVGGSSVYRHALQFQRPMIIEWRRELENTATFIGSVARKPKLVNTKTGKFGVYTLLNVRSFKESNSSSFRLLLMMWDCMAEFASKHLKPNDFICVSGCFGTYTKADASGNYRLVEHKLIVKELNFVAPRPHHQGQEESKSIEGEAGVQNDENRLYLWQVFFANPHEWWDDRKSKLNPKQPDFKHKDTGEALWLSRYDPPWVKRQLQLLDSKAADGGLLGRRSGVTTWVYDE